MKNWELMSKACVWLAAFCLCLNIAPTRAQDTTDKQQSPEKSAVKLTETSVMSNLAWRSIGPANMGGRVADIEGVARQMVKR